MVITSCPPLLHGGEWVLIALAAHQREGWGQGSDLAAPPNVHMMGTHESDRRMRKDEQAFD